MSLIPFLGGGGGDDLFTTLFGPGASSQAVAQTGNWARPLPLDVKETDKAIEVKADIPGVDKNDIKLDVNGDVLSISVEKASGKEEEKEEQGVKIHRMERSQTFVRRAIRLLDAADLGHINAKYENGVLKVEIPKKDTKDKSRQIAVD
ncbi:hypothetical protein WJX72_009723 [[Myrmecia] bisecta]|uniref:SHSP domain-containing protein n=1 Tax=[Myrmecia] bisecta TaxID=41462 RepID=A0AAW1QSH7_9CHLO